MASVARVAARIMLGDLAKIYTTPTAIVNILSKGPFSYRRADMFHDANRAIGWATHRDAMAKAVGPQVGFRDTIRSWDLPDGERYKTFGTSVWIDDETGLEIRKQSSFFSDTLWDSDEDIEEDFADLFAEDDERYKGRTFVGFEISGIEKNADMGPSMLTRIR